MPLIITKYLFNSDEEKYIADIISHTQEHDMSSKELLENTKNKKNKNKKNNNRDNNNS